MVNGKTGAGLVSMIVIMVIEGCGISLYVDSQTPLANVYKLAIASLAARFILLMSFSEAWLIVNFTALSLASILVFARCMQSLMPHPGDKMELAKSLATIFDKRQRIDAIDCKDTESVVVEEEDIEVSFLDENPVTPMKGKRSQDAEARDHAAPSPTSVPNSFLALVVMQFLCVILLVIAEGNVPGLMVEDLHVHCESCSSEIGQIALCGLIWCMLFFTMSCYAVLHVSKQYQQGGHNTRIRKSLLFTVQTMLLTGHEVRSFHKDIS